MTLNSRSAKLSSPNVKVQDVPNVPTVGTPSQSFGDILIPFTPATTGGRAAVYRVSSTPSGADAISYGSSPIAVSSGLASGTSYTFSVQGETSTGATTGYSSASSSITPTLSDMELITTTIVGNSNPTSITFDTSTLASTYKHLQVRMTMITNVSGAFQLFCKYNSDSGANYSSHTLVTNGSSVFSSYRSTGYIGFIPAGKFGVAILDILDPFSTSKFKTSRTFCGAHADVNEVQLVSMNWRSTSAITSINIYPDSSLPFTSGSRFSLYGIKG